MYLTLAIVDFLYQHYIIWAKPIHHELLVTDSFFSAEDQDQSEQLHDRGRGCGDIGHRRGGKHLLRSGIFAFIQHTGTFDRFQRAG